MISTVDFMPTLVDLLGAQPVVRRGSQCRSVAARRSQDDVVFTHPFGERLPVSSGFRVGFRLRRWPILFDWKNDPLQVHNPGGAEHADLVESIRLGWKSTALHCPHVNDWLPGQHGLESH